MKKLTIIIIALTACILTSKSEAQVFGSGISFNGTTNSSPFTTNSFFMGFPNKTVFLSGITNTNTVFTGNYQVLYPDGGNTNWVTVATFTNNMAGYTNSSFNTNPLFNSMTFTVPTRLQLTWTNGTVNAYVP